MQIIDQSPIPDIPGGMNSFQRLSTGLKYGFAWIDELQAQALLIEQFKKYLDDKFCLLRNIRLPELDVSIPMILIGPPGIHLLYVTAGKGIYRAQGDTWLVVDASRRFKPAKPNLITRTSLLARAVQVYLERRGIQNAKVDPALIFINAASHVETIRPTVRVVLSDAIGRYIAGLQHAELTMTRPEVEKVVNLLVHPQAEQEQVAEETIAPVEPPQPAEMQPFVYETPRPEAPPETAGESVEEEVEPEVALRAMYTAAEPNPPSAPPFEDMAAIEAETSSARGLAPKRVGLLQRFSRGQILLLSFMLLLDLLAIGALVFLLVVYL